MQSEFGKGLTYCLGMFLAHAGNSLRKGTPHLWFSGASDHLYELVIPEDMSQSLQKRLRDFQKKVIHWGHGFPDPGATQKDMEWALQEAIELLRMIDTDIGIETEKGQWE